MPVDTATRLAALFARTTDAVLATSLRSIEADLANDPKLSVDDAVRARAWIIAELERRHPEANAKIDAVFAAAVAQEDKTGEHVHVDYVETLLAAIGL